MSQYRRDTYAAMDAETFKQQCVTEWRHYWRCYGKLRDDAYESVMDCKRVAQDRDGGYAFNEPPRLGGFYAHWAWAQGEGKRLAIEEKRGLRERARGET